MITKEITLCGQQVTLGYCFATEVLFNKMSDKYLSDYATHTIECIGKQKDPDTEQTIYAILACMVSYAESQKKEAPLKDTDIMYNAAPAELGIAIFAILELRSQFYHVPDGAKQSNNEEEEKKEGESPNE